MHGMALKGVLKDSSPCSHYIINLLLAVHAKLGAATAGI